MSTDNGIVELNNIKIESDDQNCIHSKPRKDVYKLKEELSLRITAKRKEELKKKQITATEIPMEDSDSDYDMKSSKEIECSNDVNGGSNKENYESDVEENGNISENGDEMEIHEDDETIDGNDESNDENNADEEDDDVDEIDSERTDGCELVPKQRKRIILLDNSDDDEASSDG